MVGKSSKISWFKTLITRYNSLTIYIKRQEQKTEAQTSNLSHKETIKQIQSSEFVLWLDLKHSLQDIIV